MSDDPARIGFFYDSRSYFLQPGRVSPGNPSEHIVDAAGRHVSLAFRERDGNVLFDMALPDGSRIGLRLYPGSLRVEPFRTKTAYWNARTAAGWPARRKAKA